MLTLRPGRTVNSLAATALVAAAALIAGWSLLVGSATAIPALGVFALVLEQRRSLGQCMGDGVLFGLVSSTAGLYWCWGPAQKILGASALGSTLLLLALAGLFALRFVVLGLLWHATRSWGFSGAARLPVLLLLSEAATPTPFPFHFGYVLAELEPFNQVAELGGGGALTLLCGILSALLIQLWRGLTFRAWAFAREPMTLVGAALVVAAALFGTARLHGIGMSQSSAIEVAVVHLARAPAMSGEQRVKDVQRLFAMTDERLLSAAKNVDLTVFPEGVYPIVVTETKEKVSPLARSRFLAIGGRSRSNQRYYNAAFVAQSDGALVGTHRKERLVPFGEYLPSLLERSWIRERLPSAGRLHSEQTSSTIVRTPVFTVGISICFEDLFPDLIPLSAPASLLVNMSNDSVFHSSVEAEAHARLAALRAIESRRSMVRATRGGISGMVDPAGRWIVRSNEAGERILLARVPLAHGATLFSRFGDWPATAAWIALALAALANAGRWRRHVGEGSVRLTKPGGPKRSSRTPACPTQR